MRTASKKRPAASQGGPKPKKVHVDKSAVATKADRKRSRPVTLPAKDSDATDSDEDLGDEVEDVAEEIDQDEYSMDIEEGSGNKTPKDPTTSREAHKMQKALQEQRRAAKPHSTLLADAKRVWVQANAINISSTDRQKHIHDLMDVIRGKVKDIVFKHDASRIVQTVVKHGRQKERDEIAAELKGSYKALAQSKYSKFLVTKLIRLCPEHRQSILKEFQGHVLRLLLHREATSVLADAFELYTNAYERALLVRDFYGKETALFTVTSGSEEDKERSKKGLPGVLEGADPERRKRVLSSMKDALTSIFNNSDKGAVTHAVVHRALWEYIVAVNESPDEAEGEKQLREMFELCQDVLAELVHTKDGSRVVREFLARGSAKDRKQIVKVLKPHVERMCLDDEAQLVLFTALDVIDDTKLVVKTLVPEMTGPANTLCQTPQGRRALFYLIVPRTRRHFTPAQIASLAETDEIRARTSKKTQEVREAEVRAGASEALIKWVKDKGAGLLRETGASLVLTDIMLFADGDKAGASETLLRAASAAYPCEDDHPHPIDLPHSSRLYKTLLQGGHFNRATAQVEKAPGWDASAFAQQFVETLGKEVSVAMCTTAACNGCFVIAELCEAVKGDKDGRKTLKDWFGPAVVKEIEAGEAKGKKILLEKIAAL
ncbi:PUM-HD domain-containing protein [Mycena sanguinolenta]|uniref:PUM-HD domain-containing protein n=1 Tax=Mycena sanguinolenta TaxID=230812 RepID=A0A8H6ZHV2_9AGAR|nr:PUM-HD domain-containing protein [Mycena sanguinolenta]